MGQLDELAIKWVAINSSLYSVLSRVPRSREIIICLEIVNYSEVLGPSFEQQS